MSVQLPPNQQTLSGIGSRHGKAINMEKVFIAGDFSLFICTCKKKVVTLPQI